MPEIKSVIISTRSPRGEGDPGTCEIGHYSVIDGFVMMCNEAGKPSGKKQRLMPGDDPHKVAGRLLREAWSRQGRESDFNRPLNYGPSGVA